MEIQAERGLNVTKPQPRQQLARDFYLFEPIAEFLAKESVNTGAVFILGVLITGFLMLSKWIQQVLVTALIFYIIYEIAMSLTR